VTDVGGNLLRMLELTGKPWVEVLRSNRKNPDPLFFAIYGDVVYHHGAGFRRGAFRAHYESRPKLLRPPHVPLLRGAVRGVNSARILVWKLRHRGPQLLQSRRIFERIQRDDPQWLSEFM
jgi:hypothetical protein